MKTIVLLSCLVLGFSCSAGCATRALLPAPARPLVPTPRAELRAQPATSRVISRPDLVWQSSRLANGLEVRSVCWPTAAEASVAFVTSRGGSDEVNTADWYKGNLAAVAVVLQPLTQMAVQHGAWGAHSTDLVFQARQLANGLVVHTDVPVEHVGLALEQLAMRVQALPLDRDALARATTAVLAWRRHQNQALYPLAAARALAALYGDEYAPGQAPLDDRTSVPSVSIHELRDAYQSRFLPQAGTVLVVSPNTHEEVVALAERFFGRWSTDGAPLLGTAPPAPWATTKRFVFLHAPIADARAVIVIHTPGRSSPSSIAFPVAATVLGGGRGSRLFHALDELGIVHDLAVEYHSGLHAGQVTVRLTVPGDRAREAVERVHHEILQLARLPIPQAELSLALSQLRQVGARARETPRGVASELEALTLAGASAEEVASRDASRDQLTPAMLRDQVARAFVLQNVSTAVIGDLSGYGSLPRWAAGHQMFE